MNRSPTWVLARIKKATLFHEDHGILSSYLHMVWDGGGQGFGGLAFGEFRVIPSNNWTEDHLRSGAYLQRWIVGILTCIGVEDWANLTNKRVWILHDYETIHAIQSVEGRRIFWAQEGEADRYGHIVEIEPFFNLLSTS